MRSFAAANPNPGPRPGFYYFAAAPQATGTSAGLGVGTFRATPCLFGRPFNLDRIGAEVTTAGEAGSKVRLGIYADDGQGRPGELVVDAGQIAGDSTGVKDLTIAVTLAAGTYWFGAAVQTVTTTQPTMRTVAAWAPPILLPLSDTAPAAGALAFGISATGVTGALPTSLTSTSAGTAARLHFRAA